MYLLNISFSKSPAEVEVHQEAHGKWGKKCFQNGTFIIAGAKKSGLGGIVVAKAMAKEKLLKILAEDPFVQADVVEYQITEFEPRIVAPNLAELIKV